MMSEFKYQNPTRGNILSEFSYFECGCLSIDGVENGVQKCM